MDMGVSQLGLITTTPGQIWELQAWLQANSKRSYRLAQFTAASHSLYDLDFCSWAN
jgi:hypothetical protein